MKVGLVLEGGAMRGMYTAGVIDTFLENNIKIDGIIGVSAGALFGVNYCSNQKGRVLRYNKNHIKNKNYMGIYPLLKTGNIINKKFAFYDIPLKLDVFNEDEYQKSTTDFYVTITNINTGKAEYVKIENTKDQIEYFIATSAMPFVSKFVEINNQQYLDGALADSIPLEKCIEMGYDKIIVVLTKPLEFRRKKSPQFLPKLKYKKYPNLINTINNRYKHYNSTLDTIIEKQKNNEIFVIRPSKTVKMKRIEKDINKIEEMYNLGVEDTKNLLKELKKYLKN